jgi:hypothetical protein
VSISSNVFSRESRGSHARKSMHPKPEAVLCRLLDSIFINSFSSLSLSATHIGHPAYRKLPILPASQTDDPAVIRFISFTSDSIYHI